MTTLANAVAMFPPPGLAPPPGLELPEPSMAPPPGLNSIACDEAPMYVSCGALREAKVQISNLPNHLLSKTMLEATCQQAGLDKFVSNIDANQSKRGPCGQATISLTCFDAAARCARHFNGRCWGGKTVSARLLPTGGAPLVEEVTSNSLSANAPVFVPLFLLSAAAPVFVPGVVKAAQAPRTKSTASTEDSIPAIGSYASTEDGESASDDEKSNPSE